MLETLEDGLVAASCDHEQCAEIILSKKKERTVMFAGRLILSGWDWFGLYPEPGEPAVILVGCLKHKRSVAMKARGKDSGNDHA